ncbi:hypothetical protein [Inquilinus sp. CAU 1745]|uniref:hypothetical protein n=1 Tax=Inquilinus sp. CAU 1745 TaxID=3140369 RepID=UPI00325B8EC6
MLRVAPIAAVGFLLLGAAVALGSIDVGHLVIQRYMGEPYEGELTVRIVVPGDAPDGPGGDSGHGTARFVDEGDGRARFIVSGAIEGGENGFAVSGTYDERGWRSDEGEVVVQVSPEGRISGGGRQGSSLYTLDGSMSGERLDLVVILEALEETPGGYPPGTQFRFTYDLERSLPVADP